MKTMLMDVSLPYSCSPNVAKKVLEVSRDPGGDFLASEIVELAADAGNVQIAAAEGSHVRLSLIAVDSEDNKSKPEILSFQATPVSLLGLSGPMVLAGMEKLSGENELTSGVYVDGDPATEDPPAEDPPAED